MYTKRAELKAGAIFLVALAALLFVLFRAGGSRLPWAKGPSIHLRFAQGFAAPVVGDPVLMNGRRIGTVKAVGQDVEVRGVPGANGKTIPLTNEDRVRLKLRSDQAGAAREVYVTAVVELLDERQVLPKGTRGQITVNLTGARELALLPGRSTEDLRPDDTVDAPILTTAAGDIADIQRSIEALTEKVGTVADNANLVLADVRGVVADVKAKIAVIDLAGIQDNVLAASKDLRATLATAKGRVDEIVGRLADASASVKALAADAADGVKSVLADVKDVLAHLKTASADVEGIVQRAAPKIDETLTTVLAAVKSAEGSVQEFAGLGTRVQAVVAETGRDLDTILSRVAEGAHNLADVLEDLRANPWKLANKPEDKEIAFENLRNAASNYVRSAQAMRESLDTVRALEGRKDLPGVERQALVQKAYAALQADLSRYEETAAFFARMLRTGAAAPPR
jgi:ABC-type transporter Mla subunit MlaD